MRKESKRKWKWGILIFLSVWVTFAKSCMKFRIDDSKAKKEFDIESVFKDFPFEKAPIYFEFEFLSEEFFKRLISFFSAQKAAVYYNIDLIGNLAKTGNWFHSEKVDHQILEEVLVKNANTNILCVDV